MSADVAVLALHYQNDVLHADGKIRVGLDADSGARQRLLDNAAALLEGARSHALPIVHVRIAFRPDYADLLPNCDIFRNVARIGAVPEGQWGSAFYDGLQPLADSTREFVVKHTRISAFYGTPLEETLRLLGARRLVVAGVATHSVVEGTVRHAADIGFSVMVAEDACASADPAVHAASLASMRLIAQTAPVADAVRWAAAPN
ncbi:MAG: cysteine hydrolase [Achromobacter mucicolens]|jgi:nicotinamidase-related amidase|uniref:cysteine hydrolase family protein n=1 Tax=Achromobacter TaxID=222 RepID=UPI0020A55378|nr:cysteine hydrolase [Achromobacter mucicolens]MCP2518714.1 cysteine hydrolase [Achromobacter mucicolens]MDF2864863.1 cysteine hydrolase [Achromobacter mucicolens]MDH1525601.1 cysteine hydrolase [Achromobacter mucicolens]